MTSSQPLPADGCPLTESIENTFLRLYPDFQRVGSSCSRPGLLTRLAASPAPLLSFVRLGGAPRRVDIVVVGDDRPNAFALPGDDKFHARLVLTSGIISRLERVEQLGFVLAHEMAHAAGGHLMRDFSGTMLTRSQQEHVQRVQQSWEYEADAIALDELSRAGFDIRDAVPDFTDVPASRAPSRSHPTSVERVARLTGHINRLLATVE